MNLEQQLIDASENGHTETVKLLLDRGASTHADNNYSLRWASKNSHIEIVNLLKEYIQKEKFQKSSKKFRYNNHWNKRK